MRPQVLSGQNAVHSVLLVAAGAGVGWGGGIEANGSANSTNQSRQQHNFCVEQISLLLKNIDEIEVESNNI